MERVRGLEGKRVGGKGERESRDHTMDDWRVWRLETGRAEQGASSQP